MLYDTIAAISTSLSPAGIGIIRVSGEDAIEIVDQIFSSKSGKKLKCYKTHTIQYGFIIDSQSEVILDEVLISIMKGPNSFTKENVVEINGHGGVHVLRKILELVLRQGARLAQPGEFTKRAFLNGRIDLSQAEAIMDVINSKTDLVLQNSVSQLRGQLANVLEDIKKSLIELIAHIEASIDYPEYDIDELTHENVIQILNLNKEKILKMVKSFDSGKLYKEGIKTAIIGKPNVGKSSLLNALLREQRAIVTDIPGTTRDTLEEQMSIGGIPLNLVDTAGIRETDDFVEKIGIERSIQAINEADLVILMMDASVKLSEEDIHLLKLVEFKKNIILLNKSDLDKITTKEEIGKLIEHPHIIEVSVKEEIGMDILEDLIKELFFNGEIDLNDTVVLTNVRHKNALQTAVDCINQVIESIMNGMPEDCWAIDLKNVYEAIGEVTGDSVKEDLMEQIFSQFCLGK